MQFGFKVVKVHLFVKPNYSLLLSLVTTNRFIECNMIRNLTKLQPNCMSTPV